MAGTKHKKASTARKRKAERRSIDDNVLPEVVNLRTGRRRSVAQRRAELRAILPKPEITAQWPDKAKVALIAYSQFGIKKLAVTAAGIHQTTVDKYRRSLPGYRKAWKRARQSAADTMEVALYDRAINGPEQPIYYKGEKVGSKRVPSDLLLMFMLKGIRPRKYRDRSETEHTGDALGLKALSRMVGEIRGAREQAVIGGPVVDAEYREVDIGNATQWDTEETAASGLSPEAGNGTGEKKPKKEKRKRRKEEKAATKGKKEH